MKFTIQGRLIGLNDYTQANRTKSYLANKLKHDQEDIIASYIQEYQLQQVKSYPVILKIDWYEKSSRRDIDNIVFAKKFIMDSLVRNGVLTDDSQKYVIGFNERVYVDKENPRIEVTIEEV